MDCPLGARSWFVRVIIPGGNVFTKQQTHTCTTPKHFHAVQRSIIAAKFPNLKPGNLSCILPLLHIFSMLCLLHCVLQFRKPTHKRAREHTPLTREDLPSHAPRQRCRTRVQARPTTDNRTAQLTAHNQPQPGQPVNLRARSSANCTQTNT
jgi:hypothetical protein